MHNNNYTGNVESFHSLVSCTINDIISNLVDTEDSKWTTATIVAASVFAAILIVIVVGVLLLYIILKRRAAVHVV